MAASSAAIRHGANVLGFPRLNYSRTYSFFNVGYGGPDRTDRRFRVAHRTIHSAVTFILSGEPGDDPVLFICLQAA